MEPGRPLAKPLVELFDGVTADMVRLESRCRDHVYEIKPPPGNG
jgi:hypothetical protein